MNAPTRMTGIALAAAAAALFSSAGVGTAVAAEEAKVQCHGLNSCKGKGECKSAKNDCKGQNACKGQGFVTMSEKECKDKGGKPEAIKS